MSTAETNRTAATRFIEVFNNDAWEILPEVVAPDFTLHHPMGGTRQLGPGGMEAVWSHFKAALPDSWHPMPIMITEGDLLAVLLPTYGHFTGQPHQGIPPTGGWLEYGMVNIVRLRNGQLVEGWFGMDPLVEMQQMGAVPTPPPRQLSDVETRNVELFHETINVAGLDYDNVTAFGDVVVAMGPPQHAADAKLRSLAIYRVEDERLSLLQAHEFPTVPPFPGGLSADAESSRTIVARFIEDVVNRHDLQAVAELASPHILVHPTAMPCEAGYYGITGALGWLGEMWEAFPDLTVTTDATVAHGDIVAVRWTAQGTSEGRFLMLPPTGDPIEYTGVSMYRVEDDHVAEIWDTRNTLGIMLQLNPALASGHGY